MVAISSSSPAASVGLVFLNHFATVRTSVAFVAGGFVAVVVAVVVVRFVADQILLI